VFDEDPTMWDEIAHHIRQVTGQPFHIGHPQSVGGGCINSTWRVQDGKRGYFIKTNRSDCLDMFEAEAEGLRELHAAAAVRVPEPVCCGLAGGQAYIVMELIPTGPAGADSLERFGRELAAMHRVSRGRYGWHRDNTIGSTHQPNGEHHDWIGFWRDRRLGYQLELAAGNGASTGFLRKGERLMADFPALMDGHDPQPSLLHGDLWGGNFATTRDGEPVIFDPAVYFGDREADLAMTELFGGFGSRFYAAYDEAWPRDPGYEVRCTLYNLYHIINHFNMFGGGYGGQAERMMDRLLAELA